MSAAVATVIELRPASLPHALVGPGEVVIEALRWLARKPHPGVHMIWTTIGAVLMAVSTPHVYVWIDGVRLVHVRRDLWTDRWGQVAHRRPGGGMLLAALMPRDGMLVRSSTDQYLVLGGELVAIDQRVYRHLLRQKSET